VVPESLILLAGFALAHAVWSVSDLPKGELLVPLAMVEESGQRKLLRFEADTQEVAIAKGKALLAQQEQSLDSWAFAREGQFKEGDRYVDVISVSAKVRGMAEPIVFVQRFRPFSTGQFQLIGDPMVIISGNVLPQSEAALYLKSLREGVNSHAKVAPLWQGWIVAK